MTTKRIVYTRPDGGVSVVAPAPDSIARFKTEADAIAAVQAQNIPTDATNILECTVADIPIDRTFRDAWERDLVGAVPIRTDMPQARMIHMGRIRAARDAKLKTLDGPWMRAIGQGNTTEAARIEAQRQTLRDIPQTLDLTTAATPDDLKAIWPVILSQS